MEPRQVHEIGSRCIKAESLRYVLGGEHHARLRACGSAVLEHPQVVGPSQDVIGDAGNHKLCVLDSCMPKGVRMSDVPIDAADLSIPKLAHHARVEVDDEDLAEKLLIRVAVSCVLELMEDRARVSEETKE